MSKSAKLASLWSPDARALAELFIRQGRDIRIVGGAVRDTLLDKTPKDIDFAAKMTPSEMLHLGETHRIRTIPLMSELERDPSLWERGGLKHGTVPFVLHGEVYEVTMLRRDVETNGRHAVVAMADDFETDAARRDFTFNALSTDIHGELFDYFGGYDDLQASLVKFVGDARQRIDEDRLRILRYFRFRGRLNDNPKDNAQEWDTLQAISEKSIGLHDVSGERIWMEMSKILSTQGGLAQLDVMKACGVTDIIGLHWTLESFMEAREALDNHADPRIILGLLLNEEEVANALCDRWRVSIEDWQIVHLAGFETNLEDLTGDDLIEWATRPQIISSHKAKQLALLLQARGRDEDAMMIVRNDLPCMPITGNDLLENGMKPGRQIKVVLDACRQKWKESHFTATKEELLDAFLERNMNTTFKI